MGARESSIYIDSPTYRERGLAARMLLVMLTFQLPR